MKPLNRWPRPPPKPPIGGSIPRSSLKIPMPSGMKPIGAPRPHPAFGTVPPLPPPDWCTSAVVGAGCSPMKIRAGLCSSFDSRGIPRPPKDRDFYHGEPPITLRDGLAFLAAGFAIAIASGIAGAWIGALRAAS